MSDIKQRRYQLEDSGESKAMQINLAENGSTDIKISF